MDNPLSPINKRSPFALSVIEILFAIFVGLVTWLGLRHYLQSAIPFGWLETEEQAWQLLGYPLFSNYAIPLISFPTVSAIFLVRSIRQDVQHFSVLGNLALSWPIFSLICFYFLSVFSLIFQPIGLALAIMAMIDSGESKHHKLDWISFPFSLAWLAVFGIFVGKFFSLYGY